MKSESMFEGGCLVEIRKKDHIGVLVIDSPNNNSINRDFVREASGLLDEVGNDDNQRDRPQGAGYIHGIRGRTECSA